MPKHSGIPLRLDAEAESASDSLPAFLARPVGKPVYHGFVIVPESLLNGWVFGTISQFRNPDGYDFGDAFVVAPDNTRAGLVWCVGEFPIEEILPPDDSRWGVYSIAFATPIRTTEDFIRSCWSVLPDLQSIYARVMRERGTSKEPIDPNS
jgi:hypothetical protein